MSETSIATVRTIEIRKMLSEHLKGRATMNSYQALVADLQHLIQKRSGLSESRDQQASTETPSWSAR